MSKTLLTTGVVSTPVTKAAAFPPTNARVPSALAAAHQKLLPFGRLSVTASVCHSPIEVGAMSSMPAAGSSPAASSQEPARTAML